MKCRQNVEKIASHLVLLTTKTYCISMLRSFLLLFLHSTRWVGMVGLVTDVSPLILRGHVNPSPCWWALPLASGPRRIVGVKMALTTCAVGG